MNYTNRVCQMLHEEHDQTVVLMERLEQLITRKRGNDEAPAAGEPGVARLLGDLRTWADREIKHHFDFEEEQLFEFLAGAGNTAIGASLAEEHRVIRPLAARIADLAREASARPLDTAEWAEFRRVGQELSQATLIHVQKEEGALLPAIEDEMDPDTEARLFQDYVDTM